MKSKDRPKRSKKKSKKIKSNIQMSIKTDTESKPINPWLCKYFKMS